MKALSPGESARVLVMIEHPLITEVVKLTLNHGVYVTHEARDAGEATQVLEDWRPHLAVVDMDIGGALLQRIARVSEGEGHPIPVLALTRRGDLALHKNSRSSLEAGWEPVNAASGRVA